MLQNIVVEPQEKSKEGTHMIFDLPPILGLIPLLLYIVLLLKGVKGLDLVSVTFLSAVVAAVMTKQTPASFANAIVAGLGSFLGMIGFIVIMGAGLGKILTKTGVAQTFVHFILNTVGITTQKRAMIAIIIAAGGLTTIMGTSNGVLAILAPIIIPVCASLGFTRNAVGVLMHGAAAVGLFLGPFTPPTITTMSLSGLSYGTYLLHVALPVSILIWLSTFIMVQRIQKQTEKDPKNFYTAEEYDTKAQYHPTPESTRHTLVFLGVIVACVVYGVINKSGAAFALFVEIFSGVAVAISAKMEPQKYVENVVEGASSMMRLFICFVLCDCMVVFVGATGAFEAVANLMLPLAQSSGAFVFSMASTLIGVFGISGAAVAQEQIMEAMFRPTVDMLNFPAQVWGIILLVGSQITSFVIPGGDIYAPMSLAHSEDVKSMLKNGYVIAALTIGYVAVRALLI